MKKKEETLSRSLALEVNGCVFCYVILFKNLVFVSTILTFVYCRNQIKGATRFPHVTQKVARFNQGSRYYLHYHTCFEGMLCLFMYFDHAR
jgi:hypothetical protein